MLNFVDYIVKRWNADRLFPSEMCLPAFLAPTSAAASQRGWVGFACARSVWQRQRKDMICESGSRGGANILILEISDMLDPQKGGLESLCCNNQFTWKLFPWSFQSFAVKDSGLFSPYLLSLTPNLALPCIPPFAFRLILDQRAPLLAGAEKQAKKR